MDVKKLLMFAAGAFVIFFIVTSPDDAANIAHNLWHGTVNIAHGLGDFVNRL